MVKSNRVKLVVFVLVLIQLFTLNSANAHVIGTNGAVYKIEEPDAYDELMEKVKKINWNKVIDRYKSSIKKTYNIDLPLGKATKNRTYVFTPIYTLPVDIPDEKGNIIYPKGFQYNPLDYINFPYKIVFFNANSERELKWLQQQEWYKSYNVVLVVTNGDVIKTEEKLKRAVYGANKQIIEKLKISNTPTIVEVKNKQIVIQEAGIYE